MAELLNDNHILHLLRRFDAKMEAGRSILLSPEDVDILVACGAYRCLADAARDQREAAAKERLAALRAREAPIVDKSDPKVMGKSQIDAEAAAARVMETLKMKGRTSKNG